MPVNRAAIEPGSAAGLAARDRPASAASSASAIADAGASGSTVRARRTPKWVRVVATICLVFALFNAFYIEKQLSDKRSELSEIFNG